MRYRTLNCVLRIRTVGYDVQKDEERTRRLHCGGMVVATAGRRGMAGVHRMVPRDSSAVLVRSGNWYASNGRRAVVLMLPLVLFRLLQLAGSSGGGGGRRRRDGIVTLCLKVV